MTNSLPPESAESTYQMNPALPGMVPPPKVMPFPRWMTIQVCVTLLTVAGLFFLQAILGGTGHVDWKPRMIRVMTWNIGKLYISWESRASNQDLDHIAEVIRKYNPHVVALQELRGPSQLGRLATILGPQWLARVPEDQYDRRSGLLSRLPVHFLPLPTSTGRIAQAGIMSLAEGIEVAVVSLHLDAFDERRRLTQIEEIVAGVERLPTPRAILVGDFNFDVSIAAQNSLDQRAYRFLRTTFSDAGIGAGSTTVLSQRLDYAFYRGPHLQVVSAQVIPEQRINLMDHDPLLVELTTQ